MLIQKGYNMDDISDTQWYYSLYLTNSLPIRHHIIKCNSMPLFSAPLYEVVIEQQLFSKW